MLELFETYTTTTTTTTAAAVTTTTSTTTTTTITTLEVSSCYLFCGFDFYSFGKSSKITSLNQVFLAVIEVLFVSLGLMSYLQWKLWKVKREKRTKCGRCVCVCVCVCLGEEDKKMIEPSNYGRRYGEKEIFIYKEAWHNFLFVCCWLVDKIDFVPKILDEQQ